MGKEYFSHDVDALADIKIIKMIIVIKLNKPLGIIFKNLINNG